jgi:hypothetical protein
MDLLYVNGVDVYATYGVFLIEEKGLLDPLAQKTSLKHDWKDQSGFKLNFSAKLAKERKFSLKLGIRNAVAATWRSDLHDFFDLFHSGTAPSVIKVASHAKGFVAMVSGRKPMNRLTHYNSSLNVGIFTMNFTEPEPITRTFLVTGSSSTASCTGPTDQGFNVYWGDGEASTFNAANSAPHTFSGGSSPRTVVVAGRMDLITGLSVTNGSEQTW